MPRVKPHFKIHTSIRNHRKTAAWWRHAELRGTYVELGILAVERFADRTGDSFLIGISDVMGATGVPNPGGAARRLYRLADLAATTRQSPGDLPAISVEPIGDLWRITLPNFAKKQGFEWRKGEEGVPLNDSPPPPPPPTKNKRESAQIEEAWNLAREAAATYGRRWQKLTDARKRMLHSRLQEHADRGVEVAAHAVHGYVALRRSPTFEWEKFLVPETIFRACNFTKYLEARDQAEHTRRAKELLGGETMTEPPADFKKKVRARNI